LRIEFGGAGDTSHMVAGPPAVEIALAGHASGDSASAAL